jgi:hypothetical protein
MEVSGEVHATVVLTPSVPIEWEDEWYPAPAWTRCRGKKYLVPAGIPTFGRPCHGLLRKPTTLSRFL